MNKQLWHKIQFRAFCPVYAWEEFQGWVTTARHTYGIYGKDSYLDITMTYFGYPYVRAYTEWVISRLWKAGMVTPLFEDLES
jgi:hypothetical protein